MFSYIFHGNLYNIINCQGNLYKNFYKHFMKQSTQFERHPRSLRDASQVPGIVFPAPGDAAQVPGIVFPTLGTSRLSGIAFPGAGISIPGGARTLEYGLFPIVESALITWKS